MTSEANKAPTMDDLRELAKAQGWKLYITEGSNERWITPGGRTEWLNTKAQNVSFGFWMLWNQRSPA